MASIRGKTVEVVGLTRERYGAMKDATDTILVREAVCHFDPDYVPALQNVRPGWPVRVRGTVGPRASQNGGDLYHCGLIYGRE